MTTPHPERPSGVDVAAVRALLVQGCPHGCLADRAVAALDQLQRENARLTQDVGAAYLQGIKQGHVEREADLAAAKAALASERQANLANITELHNADSRIGALKAALAQAEQERDAARALLDARHTAMGRGDA